MRRSENIELTVLCLLRRGEEILLQNRTRADWRGFALPGGHVETGESVTEAVIREIREETGLTLHHPILCGIKQFPTEAGRYLVLLFCCDTFTGELRSSREGEMRWVCRDELDRLDTVADLKDLLRVMEDPLLTEFQYVPKDDHWDVVLR